jgi:molybdopterin molybdotransferase
MIPIEEAEKILSSVNIDRTPQTEEINILDSLGRILGSDIVSSISMPPFDKSAMDGYALKADDDSESFEVVEIIAAGAAPTKTISKGQCAKIMTGAMVPDGADRVVKVEVTEEFDGFMRITDIDPNQNICYHGENIKPGDTILKAGHLIRPPEVGIIASMGLDKVNVYQQPLVGIVTTGTEIVEPGNPLAGGQIYNSNAYSLASQVRQTGAGVSYTGVVHDSVEHIKEKIENLLEETQLVLISGGVSMGDYDFVPHILKELEVNLHFDKVAIQPGKPTVFGTRGNTLVFGMPGNPVSTFTIFEVFVKPMLFRLMGHHYSPLLLKGILKRDLKRKRGIRTAYVPVQYDNDGLISPVEYHGSAHLSALSRANALLKIPRGVLEIPEGSTVNVRQI